MANAKVTYCRADEEYNLWLSFDDGSTGAVYLGNLIDVGAFRHWRNMTAFLAARPGPTRDTIEWPVGVRLDAEILRADLAARRASDLGSNDAFKHFMARVLEYAPGDRKLANSRAARIR